MARGALSHEIVSNVSTTVSYLLSFDLVVESDARLYYCIFIGKNVHNQRHQEHIKCKMFSQNIDNFCVVISA